MFCSAKFLSPMVTGGLPAPGPPLDEAAVVPPVLELVVLPLELPHAASTRLSANAAPAAARSENHRVDLLSVMRRPLCWFALWTCEHWVMRWPWRRR